MKSNPAHEVLDDELIKAIVTFVIEKLREEEEKASKTRHDKIISTVKLLLSRYRFIVDFADNATFEAARLDDDPELQDAMYAMTDGRGSFRSEVSSENALKARAAKARTVADHVSRMFECYRRSAERSGKPEEMRRYRVVKALYFDEMPPTVDEVAEIERVDLRTVYNDIDNAADRLAVFFFGVYGLRFF